MTNLKKEAMAREGFDARHDYCPDSVRRDAAGWVLSALDAAETQRFAQHLLTCRACRMAVAELRPAAEALLALSTLQPPEHLATATLAKVRQTARDTAIRQIAAAMAIMRAEGSHSPAGLGTGLRMAAATGTGHLVPRR